MMEYQDRLTVDEVRDFVRLNGELDGVEAWHPYGGGWKPLSRTARSRVSVNGWLVPATRIIFALYHGRWPDGYIDHIDGDPQNNHITNLREVTPSQNAKNHRRQPAPGSPCVGISNSRGRWVASIGHDNKSIYLGSFCNVCEAISARLEAEELYGHTEAKSDKNWIYPHAG